MNIVKQKHWDDSYKGWKFYVAENEVTDFLDIWLKRLSRKIDLNNCFEIGCYPGSYLAHVSRKYELVANGVDITPELNERFEEWLKSEGVTVGSLYCDDAFKVIERLNNEETKYDFVYSLGFVEHFEEYIDVIKRHGDILRKNGVLIVTTPNFAGGFQRCFHKLVDMKNYKRHVIRSMNPFVWKKELEKEGYKTLFCGYFGRYGFWVDKQKRNIFQKFMVKFLAKITEPMKKILRRDSRFFSPYCGIVMIKK